MKTVSKEFWIDDNDLENIKKGKDFKDVIHFYDNDRSWKNKITITYEIPDKRIEISESEFGDLFKYCNSNVDLEFVKEKLFGEK